MGINGLIWCNEVGTHQTGVSGRGWTWTRKVVDCGQISEDIERETGAPAQHAGNIPAVRNARREFRQIVAKRKGPSPTEDNAVAQIGIGRGAKSVR